MSEAIEGYRDMAELRKALRAMFGVECPECKRRRPRGNATLMLPGQRCKVDRYVDTRGELDDAAYQAAWDAWVKAHP